MCRQKKTELSFLRFLIYEFITSGYWSPSYCKDRKNIDQFFFLTGEDFNVKHLKLHVKKFTVSKTFWFITLAFRIFKKRLKAARKCKICYRNNDTSSSKKSVTTGFTDNLLINTLRRFSHTSKSEIGWNNNLIHIKWSIFFIAHFEKLV